MIVNETNFSECYISSSENWNWIRLGISKPKYNEYVLVGWFDQFDEFVSHVAKRNFSETWETRTGHGIATPDFWRVIHIPITLEKTGD